jgi:biopolymer transport protein ExbD
MTTWKIRHQGSPQSLEGLSAEQIVEGVQEGQWEPSDEVRGPGDADWVSLEMHPHFADAMADIDPPMAPPPPDETRLDMNPLIDVSLVLLIFFILTTTYEELRKMFPAPPAGSNEGNSKVISPKDLGEIAIRVTAKQEGDQTVIRVENEVVPENELQAKFESLREQTRKSKLAVELDKNVPWKTFIAIQDAAAGAKIQETIRIQRAQPKDE